MTDEEKIIEEQRIAEYQILRQELIAKQSSRVNLIGFTIAGIGALFTAAATITTGDYLPQTGVFVLIILSISHIIEIQYSTAIGIISRYIKEILEANEVASTEKYTGFSWEKWQDKIIPSHVLSGSSKVHSLFYLILAEVIYIFSNNQTESVLIGNSLKITLFINILLGIGVLVRNTFSRRIATIFLNILISIMIIGLTVYFVP